MIPEHPTLNKFYSCGALHLLDIMLSIGLKPRVQELQLRGDKPIQQISLPKI